jgi:hypothetical protein
MSEVHSSHVAGHDPQPPVTHSLGDGAPAWPGRIRRNGTAGSFERMNSDDAAATREAPRWPRVFPSL